MTRSRSLVTAAELDYVAAHPELTREQLAEHLHTTPNHIQHCRRLLRRQGRGYRKSGAGLSWTADEATTIKELAGMGKTVWEIARRVGRTPGAVYQRIAQLGGLTEIRRNPYAAIRTARQLGDLMGVQDAVVLGWLERGWLAGRRNRNLRTAAKSHRRTYMITDEALQSFLEDRRYWPAWEPSAITDRDWRETAELLRREAGGHWLSLADLSERYQAAPTTVRGWWAKGILSSELTHTTIGRQHFVWSTDLDTFVPPYDRPRGDSPCQ